MTFYIGTADLTIAKQRDLDRPLINVTGIRHRIVNMTVGRRLCYMCSSYKIHDLLCRIYEVVSEMSRIIIVVTSPLKDESGGQGHIYASLLQQSAT